MEYANSHDGLTISRKSVGGEICGGTMLGKSEGGEKSEGDDGWRMG